MNDWEFTTKMIIWLAGYIVIFIKFVFTRDMARRGVHLIAQLLWALLCVAGVLMFRLLPDARVAFALAPAAAGFGWGWFLAKRRTGSLGPRANKLEGRGGSARTFPVE